MAGGDNFERRPLYITGSSVSPDDFNEKVRELKNNYLGNSRILKSEAVCKAEGLEEYTELCKSRHLDEALKTVYKITMSIPGFGNDEDYATLASAIFSSNSRNNMVYPDYQPLFQTILGYISRYVSGNVASKIKNDVCKPIILMASSAESDSSRSWSKYFSSAMTIANFFKSVARIARDELNMR